MVTNGRTTPPQPGEPAPDFTLPVVNHEGTVSLSDFRGKQALFLALFRGLYCPFCRRAIAELGTTRESLERFGVQALGVVATPAENARMYFRFRPSKVLLAADPELGTHRAFGLPKGEMTSELVEAIQTVKVNPTGELAEPLTIQEAGDKLNRMDGFEPTSADLHDMERQSPQLLGQFLIDSAGLVRWVNVECAREGLSGFGRFPSVDEVMAAVREAKLA